MVIILPYLQLVIEESLYSLHYNVDTHFYYIIIKANESYYHAAYKVYTLLEQATNISNVIEMEPLIEVRQRQSVYTLLEYGDQHQ